MPDYKNMTATEAVRHSKDISGKTIDELSRLTGIRTPSFKRYMQNDEGYCPGLDKLPAIIKALGNDEILNWLYVQLEHEPEKIVPAKSRAEVLTVVARANASLGDVQRVLADSEERGIDPPCAREARSLLQETIAQCRRAYAMLDEQASHRDITQIAPLASIKPERKSWLAKMSEFFGGKNNVG